MGHNPPLGSGPLSFISQAPSSLSSWPSVWLSVNRPLLGGLYSVVISPTITLLFIYNSRITTQHLEQNMTLCECLRRCTGICSESRVTCMKELWRWPCHKYDVNYMIMQNQYDNDGVCHNKRNGGKLHGNISQNGYGNAIIGRYGGCFEEGKWWVYDTGESCAA